MNRSVVVLFALLACGLARAEDARPKLLVLEFSSAGGVESGLSQNLMDAVSAELSSRGYFQVLTAKDVQTLLGVERQKELLGCSETSSSCQTELAGALGAQLALSGTVGKIGDAYQLTLQALDTQRAQTVGRSVKLAKTAEGLRATVPVAAAEATGIPVPAPPSRVLPISLIAAGAAALVGGGVLGLQAINQDNVLSQQLQTGASRPAVLGYASDYDRQVAQVAQQRTLSLVVMAAGAAAVVGGVVLMPKGSAGGAELALHFTGNGVAVAGVLP